MRNSISTSLVMLVLQFSLSYLFVRAEDAHYGQELEGIVSIGAGGVAGAAAVMDAVGHDNTPANNVFIAASASSARHW
jgi:hypothetical protein